MKRLPFFFAVFLILIPQLTAYADVVIEPNNSFYKQYSNQCVYLGRSFIANGENGSIAVKQEPGAKNDMARLQNGEVVYMQVSCLYDGDIWGLTTYEGIEFGWVKLEETLVLYDYVSFEEAHIDELYPYSGDFNELKETGTAIVWEWPGSGRVLWTVNDVNPESLHVSCAYKDEHGREWGFISYMYGSRNVWICISDPLNRDIPAFNPESGPVKWETETKHTEIVKTDNMMIILIIILVAALVAGTVILIKIFWKPQKAGAAE